MTSKSACSQRPVQLLRRQVTGAPPAQGVTGQQRQVAGCWDDREAAVSTGRRVRLPGPH